MGTNEENIIENLVCFIYGGARAGPLHRLRPKSTGSGSATLGMGMYLYWTRMGTVLKGQCHEIFYLYFFSCIEPSGPMINRLK